MTFQERSNSDLNREIYTLRGREIISHLDELNTEVWIVPYGTYKTDDK